LLQLRFLQLSLPYLLPLLRLLQMCLPLLRLPRPVLTLARAAVC
jgi:hypothetical protein